MYAKIYLKNRYDINELKNMKGINFFFFLDYYLLFIYYIFLK